MVAAEPNTTIAAAARSLRTGPGSGQTGPPSAPLRSAGLGSIDKLPNFGLPFFYRVALPGVVVGAAALPLLARWLKDLVPNVEQQAVILLAAAVAVGFVLAGLDQPIYWFFEGRRFWWEPVADLRARAWRARVAAWLARQAELSSRDRRTPAEQQEYDEIWAVLKQFPASDGKLGITATRPTRLGNVLAAYESYPPIRYGMPPGFYWPRLWMSLDKETRTSVDESWASADAFLYIATGLLAVAMAHLATAFVAVSAPFYGLRWSQFAPGDAVVLAAAFVALVAASFMAYSIAVPVVARNGENFKSVFDLHAVTSIGSVLLPTLRRSSG